LFSTWNDTAYDRSGSACRQAGTDPSGEASRIDGIGAPGLRGNWARWGCAHAAFQLSVRA
jgi:hypothetical protein